MFSCAECVKRLAMENVLIDQHEPSRMWISSTPKGQFLELGKSSSRKEGQLILNYSIFNALGKIEMEGTLPAQRKIDIHMLGRGIYFIQLLFADQTQVMRQFMKI